jgi:hypothetical protein
VLRLNRYSTLVVLLIAGIFTVIFAYATLNLFQMSMANIGFLQKHGWAAIQAGALWQLAQIVGSGAVAMLSYIGFKICETEVVRRYHKWQDK